VRVLFSSVGAAGHVYPMVPLARALLANGHEIRWACTAELCPVIDRAGIPTVTTVHVDLALAEGREGRAQRMAEIAQLPPERRDDYLFPWVFGEVLAPAMLRDLLLVVKEWRPHLVVHDHYEFAGPIAATAVGAAHVTHSLGPLTPEHHVSSAGAAVSTLWKAAGCDPRPYGGLYDHLYLDIYPPSIQRTGGDQVGRRQLLRPAPYPPAESTDLPTALSVNPDRPLVYVTFGTQLTRYETLRLVIDAISRLKVRLLVTIGAQGKLDTFGAQRPGVAIERFVPQTSVLPHASAVVSHAGSGTVLAALGAGLPQLFLPYHGDQAVNAQAVSDTGAGLALDIDPLDDDQAVQEIGQAVARLLDEPEFAERAGHVAAEIADMPPPDQVASVLTEFE
jgi:UDP:flavonoid glycosyltransferase YjiC (YdhE family)